MEFMSIAPLAAGEDVQIPFGAEITQDEAAAMLRAIFNLFMRWGVPDSEGRILLGQPSRRTYARWKSGKISSVPHDIKQRLSYLMGISCKN